MKKVLLVKTSSLGDVVHNLPVATDIRRQLPHAAIDWVVEEQYRPLVEMHAGVNRVIPVALRRWRRTLCSPATWREFDVFRRELRGLEYDAIVDTQGLWKSVFIAKIARGPSFGFGPRTAREPLAARLYDVTSEFPPETHKILRYRSVAARALQYQLDGPIDHGIAPRVARPAFVNCPYWIAFHSAARTWPAKLWPEASWAGLVSRMERAGLKCILPWGDDAERTRSERLAAQSGLAIVPPRLSLDELAALISAAELVVGVDTGLMHLAAALVRPVVGIYCDSNPVDAGSIGSGPTAFRGQVRYPPDVEAVIAAVREVRPGLL